jgi:anti-sigma factor RsiW
MRAPDNVHDEMLRLASSALDEPLAPEEAQRLEAHLETCAYCRAEVQRLRGVDTTLRQVPVLNVPHAFTQQVLAAAFREGSVARGLSFGIFILLIGALFMSGLWLLANVDLLGGLLNLFLNPAQVSDLQSWGPRTWEAIGDVWNAGWRLVAALRDLLFGPLLVPALVALMVSAVGLWLVRRTSHKRAAGASRG